MRFKEQSGLDEQILELYDSGMSVVTISRRLNRDVNYVARVLSNIPLEAT